jgi:dTDP-4-amino-4,6-dideoxygalactose transaminase
MNIINCLDLKEQHIQLKSEIFAEFEKVFDKTAFSGGEFVEEFERNFSAFTNSKYCIGLNNGTNAIHLALLALGIGSGDEVIIPANSFIATAWGVTYTGATPVMVDCDENTWQISTDSILKNITKKTKAIIGVHLYGQPFDIDSLQRICKDHNIFLLEDTAQAQGALYNNKVVGTFGEMGCFSFYPGKNLGACGEAGGIITNNEKYCKHLQKLRNHGCEMRYFHEIIGYNMRMGGLEAASLIVKLRYLSKWNSQRQEIAERYQSEIKNEAVRMQLPTANAKSVYHLFVIVTADREKLMQYLKMNDVNAALHYPLPIHLQRAYSNLGYKKGDLPNSEYLAEHCLSLPMYPEMKSESVSRVIELINKY